MSCEEKLKNNTVMEGHKEFDVSLVNISNERIVDCIALVRLEIENNHEWTMELRKKVGLQALIWPFILIGVAITSKSVNLGAIQTILDSYIGIVASIILFMSFIALGIAYGFLERRLWERMQYLRRLFMSIVVENSNDESNRKLSLGCLTETEFNQFDARGAYLIQYLLVSCIVASTLVLITFMVIPCADY